MHISEMAGIVNMQLSVALTNTQIAFVSVAVDESVCEHQWHSTCRCSERINMQTRHNTTKQQKAETGTELIGMPSFHFTLASCITTWFCICE